MGRNIMKGLLYFRLDTNFGDKTKYLLIKRKASGYGIFVLILRKIYANEGYYCKWDSTAQVLFCDYGIELLELQQTVECCFEIGLFDRAMYDEYKVLTSAEIQHRYTKIIIDCKRKGITIAPHLLLNYSEETGINSEEIEEEGVYVPEVIHQSKVKNSIVNESIVNFLRLRDKIFEMKVSDYMIKNESIFMEQWAMQNKNIPVQKVLDEMDKEYICHHFNSENHIKNAFKSSAKKITNGTGQNKKSINDRV